MNRLGYTRYVAQGGDVGAAVTDAMGRQAPEGLLGIHQPARDGVGIVDQLPAESEQERAARDALATFRTNGFGYFLEQATRPQTIGYALLDSPVALAAWMLDHDTDSYYKISRAFVDGSPWAISPGPHRRQHHAVLADGHRGLGGPVVLGGRTAGQQPRPARLLRRSRSRSASPRSPARSGLPAQLGREGLPQASPTSTRSTRAATSPRGRTPTTPSRLARPSVHEPSKGAARIPSATAGARRPEAPVDRLADARAPVPTLDRHLHPCPGGEDEPGAGLPDQRRTQ